MLGVKGNEPNFGQKFIQALNLVYRFFIRNKLNNKNRVGSKTFSTKIKSQKLKTTKIAMKLD